ncbi:hypothetical protein BY458DRAFT_532438 [Sporodiniella umbellata]|nr:hypothetical protein BY458DRAFT_532438 [Sporodiniella umbellata]
MHQAYKEPQNDLLSPPLTPTEPTMQYWHQDRKAFIQSYGRMAPFLKRGNRHRVFSLHVYRDYLLAKGEQGFSTEARSDKAAVSPSKNRKSLDPKKRRVSALPSGKDAAAAFDALDIESQDLDFYPPQWAPRQDRLDSIPIKVSWKGAPMAIHQHPMYSRLHPVEASMASVLRLSPIQYLRCKRTLILAARTLKYQTIPFTKSVAQKLCRVDVNKTSALWTAYGQLGWFEESI